MVWTTQNFPKQASRGLSEIRQLACVQPQTSTFQTGQTFKLDFAGNLQLLQFLRCFFEAWIQLRRGGEGLANPLRRRGADQLHLIQIRGYRIQASGNPEIRKPGKGKELQMRSEEQAIERLVSWVSWILK